MKTIGLLVFFVLINICLSNDYEKYRPLREQCQRDPSSIECSQLKSKFFQLIQKCQSITTSSQLLLCKEVQIKLCNIFPSTCSQTTLKSSTISTTKRKITKKKVSTTKSTLSTKLNKPKSSSPTPTTTTTTMLTTMSHLDKLPDNEFVKVPVDPEELRTRGDYCLRHNKEKKCQQLLNNLKTTYSTCGKKKINVQPEQIDCHSFQTHLCKAFPKFPPCLKKTSN
ncbi:unnamed protein product [Adineta ricciae]|uniref:Uncharacterized protein n=1 Tax=Adineta ricciae TaxID=249248 RepID=A0A815JUL6_ADIRI|nr:unnamed protein product [Adineta ricciae]CAF1569421.1 unnamed protein product [Adineta ricciae]